MKNTILQGDALSKLKEIPDNYVDCIITSPPYYKLRDYKIEGQIGQEKTVEEYVDNLIKIFEECKRVLKKEGTVFIVIGDSYNGNKSLCLVPQRFAVKMVDNGWITRNIPIWYKPNVIPFPVKDRFQVDYEFIYFFTKSQKYYFKLQYEPYSPVTIKEFEKAYNGNGKKDYEGNGVQNPSDVKRRIIMSGQRFGGSKFQGYGNRTYSGKDWILNSDKIKQGRIKRSVWKISTQSFHGAHFAVFPEKLVKQCLDAGCPPEGLVCDPFLGSGTTALVALKNNRNFLGIELSQNYIDIALKRIEPYLYQTKLAI